MSKPITYTLVEYKQAVRLKKAGFNIKVRDYYVKVGSTNVHKSGESEFNYNLLDTTISRPSIELATKWLRIKFGYYILIDSRFNLSIDSGNGPVHIDTLSSYDSALRCGIYYCLQLILNK